MKLTKTSFGTTTFCLLLAGCASQETGGTQPGTGGSAVGGPSGGASGQSGAAGAAGTGGTRAP
jgi:hypothetical protein